MPRTRTPGLAPLHGRIGGLVARSHHDPRDYTAKARRTFLESFERLVDPDGLLAPEERQARAEAAKKAHFAELAYRSAVVRAERTAGRRGSASGPRDRARPAAGGVAAEGELDRHIRPSALAPGRRPAREATGRVAALERRLAELEARVDAGAGTSTPNRVSAGTSPSA